MIARHQRSARFGFHVALGVAAAILASRGIAGAQAPFQVLHEFSGYRFSEGPEAPLIQALDGNFYGTTHRGGAFNRGTIFRTTPSGAVTVLHTFAGGSEDGAEPAAALLQGSDGNFYGTTVHGGAFNAGTIFRMTPAGHVDILRAFGGHGDGASPYSALIQAADGFFYGTTVSGGTFHHGTSFRMTADGVVVILHSFEGGPSDGAGPFSALVQASDGNFYGTTYSGGPLCPYGCDNGTIFRMTADGAVDIVHFFHGGPTDGAHPMGALIQASDGNLYGTTGFGGDNSGTVFKVTLAGVIALLHVFDEGVDGSLAYLSSTLLRATDGDLYGTTLYGPTWRGTVFRITATGAFTTLHEFSGGADGAEPAAGLMQARDGRLYGTTAGGGYSNFGTLFTITAAGAVTILHSFKGSAEGAYAQAPLVQASDGNFYGTTSYGGAYNLGTIFRVTPGGRYTLLYTFAGGLDGGYPHGALVQGRDGKLYGITTRRGKYDAGTTFRMTLNGEFRTLHAFNGAADGAFPAAGLTQGRDGHFYGTTGRRGAFDRGTVFRMSPDGNTTTLHDFTGTDYAAPRPGLVQASDGNLYGTVDRIAFRLTLSGGFTPLHQFDGYGAAIMVQGRDGHLYGATPCYSSGTDVGQLFRLTTGGVFSALASTGTVCSDSRPESLTTLTLGRDGLIYGTVSGSVGGLGDFPTSESGTVFALAPTGAITALYQFPPGDYNDSLPEGLVHATDGNLYGTTAVGGAYDGGVVFRLRPVPPAPLSVNRATRRDATVRLTWTPIANATSYRIKRGTVAGGETPLASGVTATSFVDMTATRGQTYYYVVTAMNAFGESGSSYEVSVTAGRATLGDFDGDGMTDITVSRPSNGTWYILKSSSSFTAGAAYVLGSSSDLPVVGDFDGDGQTDVAVYRPATGDWVIRRSSTSYATSTTYQWGTPGDVPVPNDYDGDGQTDLAIYRPSTGRWYILKSSTGFTAGAEYALGASTDLPVPGDYDGDGAADLAVFRASTGHWFIRLSSTSYATSATYQWGTTGDFPVPGDYDGDGKTDLAVYRPLDGTWYILKSSTGFMGGDKYAWGTNLDVLVPGDYDGDGRTDLAVYRPSTGHWFIRQSTTNYATWSTNQWGTTGDRPVLTPLPSPPAPARLVVGPAANAHVTLTWAAVAGTATYTIKRGTTAGGEVALASGLINPTYVDTTATKGKRYYYVVSAANALGESKNSYEVSITAGRAVPGDFDGDGKTDLAVYRPSTGTWHILTSSSAFTGGPTYMWGAGTDVPAPGDYDGDGQTDVAVFRASSGHWFILQSSTNYATWGTYRFGGTVPVPGDYDGDGKSDLALMLSTFSATVGWGFRSSSTNFTSGNGCFLGSPGPPTHLAVQGDYDADGKTDIALFQPATGTWHTTKSSNAAMSTCQGAVYEWGTSSDVPVPGDYDGDGKTDLAVFRPATAMWYLRKSSTNFTVGEGYASGGTIADVPVPGDYDGDGRTDLALYRPSTGEWFILLSSTDYATSTTYHLGAPGDIPVLKLQ